MPRRLAALTPVERAARRLRDAERRAERARRSLVLACAAVTKYERLAERLRRLLERRQRETLEPPKPRRRRVKVDRLIDLD